MCVCVYAIENFVIRLIAKSLIVTRSDVKKKKSHPVIFVAIEESTTVAPKCRVGSRI